MKNEKGMINVDLDWERKSQTVSGWTHAGVKERAADSALHIKMSNVTYQGLAGSCACACNEPDMKATWRDMDVDWWRLCESVPMCRPVYIYYMESEIWVFVFEKGKRKRNWENSRGRAMKHWQHIVVGFLHRVFCYTLVVISLTNSLPGGLSIRT